MRAYNHKIGTEAGNVARFVLAGLALAALAPASAPAAAGPISVHANHLVNSHRKTVRLLGVDRSGTEYACAVGGGYGFTDSVDYRHPDSNKLIAAIRLLARQRRPRALERVLLARDQRRPESVGRRQLPRDRFLALAGG